MGFDICRLCSGRCCDCFTLTGFSWHGRVHRIRVLHKRHKDYVSSLIGDSFVPISDEEDGMWKCLLHDKETKLCTDYDNRPNMCKDYRCSDYDSVMEVILTDKRDVV